MAGAVLVGAPIDFALPGVTLQAGIISCYSIVGGCLVAAPVDLALPGVTLRAVIIS